MKKFNKLVSLLLAVSVVFSAVPAMAAEEIIASGSDGHVPVTLNVGDKNNPDNPVLNFSVTVPTTLPVHVDGDGVVTVAGGANGPKIINRSSGPVKVEAIDVVSQGSWLLADWSANLLTEQVNTKKYALAIQGSKDTRTDVGVTRVDDNNGTGDTTTFEQIPGKGAGAESSKAFAYNAHIAPQATDVTAEIANVVFTIGWDEATPSGTESKVEDTYNDPDILKYDTDTETYVAKVDKPILVKANIYYGETEPTVALAALEEDSAGTYSMRKAAAKATAPTYEWSVTDEAAAQIDTTDCTPGTAKVTMIKANAPIEINCKATIGNATLNAEPIKFKGWSDEPEYLPYLTFECTNGEFDLGLVTTNKYYNGTIYYSLDAESWHEWDRTKIESVNGRIYLKGSDNTVFTNPTYLGYIGFTLKPKNSGEKIKCIGNIETLLDWQKVVNGEHPTMGDGCFGYTFAGCSALIQAPELPSENLSENCYKGMFYKCSSLKEAPKLPATTLTKYCYTGMFQGTSLTEAPELPGTTLADSCYSGMFSDCKLLTQAPKLPVTTLAPNCYANMFNGCTSLTQAPALPATILTSRCYTGMFQGCSSLVGIPALPARYVQESAYENMFNGCTALKIAQSSNPGEGYTVAYKLPDCNNLGDVYNNGTRYMFANTSGKLTGALSNGTPSYFNHTYYLHSFNNVVRE